MPFYVAHTSQNSAIYYVALRHELHVMALHLVTYPQCAIKYMRTHTQICSFGSRNEFRNQHNNAIVDNSFSFGPGDFALFLGVQAESPRSQAAPAAVEYV